MLILCNPNIFDHFFSMHYNFNIITPMWNQMFSSTRITYQPYNAKKKQQLAKLARYKLIILLLSRYTYSTMRESLNHISKVTNSQKSAFQKLWAYMNRNAFTAQKSSFQKLKQNIVVSRSFQTTLKNMITLLERITRYKAKKTFASIALYAQRKNKLMISNMDHMRKIIFCAKVQRLFALKKRQHLQKMVEYSKFLKAVHKKVKISGIIGSKYIKNVKQACFNRLVKNLLSLKSQNFNNNNKAQQGNSYNYQILLKQQNERKNLQKRLNDMQSDIESKNASICKLEQEILQLKMEQSSNNFNSFSQYTLVNNNSTNNNNSNSLYNSRKRLSQKDNKRRQNQSLDSGFDFSLGSILGNSFSLNKSRSKDLRTGGESVASIDCNCKYKEKYIKMKNSNESLKNQLQIVKQELEVAKDLNDHFTNQIRQYFNGQKDSIELDRLRKEVKELQKEREEMKMKISKYQNHINTLKSQFKLKIQELYRKVKKDR